MSRYFTMSRRRFVSVLGALGALSVLSQIPLLKKRIMTNEPADGLPERLTRIYAHSESAVAVGLAYLQTAPHEADQRTLVNNICQHATVSSEALSTSHSLRSWARHQVREDFKSGRTVAVDGWILAETEVRLCALQAIRQARV